jgi:alkylation response protein AidB-like acyl-CoA dehydrogenase
MVAPTLIEWSTDSSRCELVEGTRRGKVIWCQLFSEPDAGSDLRSMRTTATRTGAGGWRLDGQKVWTSNASCADYGLAIARQRDSSTTTCFIVPMDDPQVEVTPIPDMTGGRHVNMVHLNGIQLDSDSVVGEVGEGWQVARALLRHERIVLGALASLPPTRFLRELSPAGKPPSSWIELAMLEMVLEATCVRAACADAQHAEHLPSVVKLLGSRVALQMMSTLGELGGMGLVAEDPENPTMLAWARDALLFAPALRIGGGTDEIQRNILAERYLGLPS